MHASNQAGRLRTSVSTRPPDEYFQISICIFPPRTCPTVMQSILTISVITSFVLKSFFPLCIILPHKRDRPVCVAFVLQLARPEAKETSHGYREAGRYRVAGVCPYLFRLGPSSNHLITGNGV